MTKVSTIIAAYNAEAYIQEAIESVLSQFYKDIELIVVDDASTDKTAQIAKGFGSRLEYIRHSENKGLSAARNRGIKQAKGKYIAILDADDVWLPNKIQEQIRLLEGNDAPAIVYSNCYIIGPSSLKKATFFDSVKPQRGLVFEQLLLDNFIPTPSVIIKKEILDEVGGFNERFLVSQDFDLYLRITQHHKVDFVDFPLLKLRIHPGSLSSKKRKVMLEEAISITRFYRDKVSSKNQCLARKLDKKIAKYMFYIAIWSLEHINRRDALRCYFDCVKTGAFDYKIALGSIFFILSKFISIPLMRKLIKIQGAFINKI